MAFHPPAITKAGDAVAFFYPVTQSYQRTMYQHIRQITHIFLKSATIIQYTIKGRFMSR